MMRISFGIDMIFSRELGRTHPQESVKGVSRRGLRAETGARSAAVRATFIREPVFSLFAQITLVQLICQKKTDPQPHRELEAKSFCYWNVT
jgi:hypothetical protein